MYFLLGIKMCEILTFIRNHIFTKNEINLLKSCDRFFSNFMITSELSSFIFIV